MPQLEVSAHHYTAEDFTKLEDWNSLLNGFDKIWYHAAVRDNAAWMLPAALRTLHFSPEPRVAIKVIESATLLGRDDIALAHLARFRAAFPKEHAQWVQDNAKVLQGAREQVQGASAP